MNDKPHEPTEEERLAWIKRFFSDRKNCQGCKALEEVFRKLFFTKSS